MQLLKMLTLGRLRKPHRPHLSQGSYQARTEADYVQRQSGHRTCRRESLADHGRTTWWWLVWMTGVVSGASAGEE